MTKKTNNTLKTGPEDSKGPSSEAFRKVKWIRRKRGLIGFFAFLSVVAFVLFFDYYWVLIARVMKQPSQATEQAAGKFTKVNEKERHEIFDRTNKFLESGNVEEARKLILGYLKRESNAEGFYLAGIVYMRQGDVQSAYRNLKEAIRLQPDYYVAQQKLAEIYVSIGDLKSAQQTASILTKKDAYEGDGFLLESEIALAEGKLDEALKKVHSAIDANKGEVPEKTLIQLASLYAKKGDRAKAEQIIGKIDEKKLNATELLSLARYYFNVSRSEKAHAILNDALIRYPGSPEVQYYYGQQLFNQGKYSESIPFFQKVYTAMPQSHIASYRFGQALVASGQLDAAKRHIDDVLSRYPGDILALSLKVRYELLKGQNKEAIATLKQTVTLVPDAPRPNTLLAELYWADGIMSVAESYAQKALKLGEQTISPRVVLGDVYFRKGQYAKAIGQYAVILEREPTNLVALVQSGDAYLNLGDVKKAEGAYEKVILNYPNMTMIHTKLEMVRNLRKGPKEVLETARRFYQQNQNDTRAVNGYVQALLLNNHNDDAIGVLKQSMKKDPRNIQYPVMLGDIYLARKNMSSARNAFETALHSAPKDLNVLINIGSRYEKNSLDKEAETLYTKTLSLYPDNLLIINHLAWFYTEAKGDIGKARPLIDTLRVRGEGAYEKDTVGWFFYKTRDYSSAEAYFREALQMDPDNNVIRGHLALALFQMNKSKEALVEAERVINVLPPGDLKVTLQSVMSKKRGGNR
ncbi:MAG: Beta-barrel assembly-enhancing protease [Syntrophus sp. SKADARSKE-3]|nr:Beta-barrel assembly-enhancing protease [Syntrophus sp. SKADARSKE-3]